MTHDIDVARSSGIFRIGIIADSHVNPHLTATIATLAAQRCDHVVHLGDIGGSPTIVQLVDNFKRNGDARAGLTPVQIVRRRALEASGLRPTMAYLEALTEEQPELRQAWRTETIASYGSVIAAIGPLGPVQVVAGNVDRTWLRHAEVRRAFHRNDLILHEVPVTQEIGDWTLVFWPSVERAEITQLAAFDQAIAHLRHTVDRQRPLLILAHEPLFRGPTPALYRSRLGQIGQTSATIPFYGPSPSRHELVAFLQDWSGEILGMASGHIHDGPQIVAIGAPYLRDRHREGLSFRIGGGGTGRRRVPLFCVPADRPALIDLGPNGATCKILEVG